MAVHAFHLHQFIFKVQVSKNKFYELFWLSLAIHFCLYMLTFLKGLSFEIIPVLIERFLAQKPLPYTIQPSSLE